MQMTTTADTGILQDLKAQVARDKADVEAFLGQQSTLSAAKDRELTAAQVCREHSQCGILGLRADLPETAAAGTY